ncbi:hypothetical protein Barb6_02308 [Bacteroidales bacterium Barb6]|nr:hypothetical protein Barb6_02308 [Bacteroidales bacterium Barb6]
MTYAETLEKLHELQAGILENTSFIQMRVTVSSWNIYAEVTDTSSDFNTVHVELFHNPASPYFTDERKYAAQLDRVIKAINKIK